MFSISRPQKPREPNFRNRLLTPSSKDLQKIYMAWYHGLKPEMQRIAVTALNHFARFIDHYNAAHPDTRIERLENFTATHLTLLDGLQLYWERHFPDQELAQTRNHRQVLYFFRDVLRLPVEARIEYINRGTAQRAARVLVKKVRIAATQPEKLAVAPPVTPRLPVPVAGVPQRPKTAPLAAPVSDPQIAISLLFAKANRRYVSTLSGKPSQFVMRKKFSRSP